MEEIRREFESRLEDLKAQLEAEKPKLRHGACGIKGNSAFVTITDNDNKTRPYYKEGGNMGCDGSEYFRKNPKDYTILIPNIFDDLADMAEDLEEFKVSDGGDMLKVRLCSEGQVEFDISGITATMDSLETTKEIHRKLGRVIATAIRKAKGKE